MATYFVAGGAGFIGPEASRFLDEGWEPIREIGGTLVAQRKDSGPATSGKNMGPHRPSELAR